MAPSTFVLLSGTLTFGVPIALCIRELFLLTPTRRDGDGPPPAPTLRPAPRPLPDCLLPPRMPARPAPRVKVLEDA